MTSSFIVGIKVQWDKLKILPRDQTGRDSPSKSESRTGRRTGGYKILTACPVLWDKPGQSRKESSTTRKGLFKTEKDVLERERMF